MNPLSQAQKAVEKYPAKITAKEFLAMIDENPSGFEHWDTPLEVTEYVDCESSPITHLSKYLTFSGRNDAGDVANFGNCPNLQIATGNFEGYVCFSASNIKKIENLSIQQNNNGGMSAAFAGCKALEIATGNYAGFVSFAGSGIHSIQNLQIQGSAERLHAEFSNCPNLHTLQNWDLSKPIWIESKKLEAEKKRRTALKKFVTETQPNELPFL
jgi:hypothetical protein